MTITIRFIHFAIALAFIAGITVAVGVVLATSGEDEPAIAQDSGSVGLDIEPTLAPSPTTQDAEPTPTPEPSATPQPEPTAAPTIRSCAEIRADPTYRSPEERSFFLDNCLDAAAPAAPAANNNQPSSAPSSSSEATAAEQRYRERAEGSVNIFAVRIRQYLSSPSSGATGDVLEFGAVMRRYAQELDTLPDAPPRFKQAHDQFRAALISFADYTTTIVNLDYEDEDDVIAWLDGYFDSAETMVEALEDYAVVLGIDLPADFTDDS